MEEPRSKAKSRQDLKSVLDPKLYKYASFLPLQNTILYVGHSCDAFCNLMFFYHRCFLERLLP